MRRIARRLLPAALLILSACSSIDCPLNNVVYLKMTLDDGSGMMSDTLNVIAHRPTLGDTTMVNCLVEAGSTWVEMSYAQDVDVLILNRHDSTGRYSIDTLLVEKSNQAHFESVDCAPAYFHEIKSVSHTHHGLDSAVLYKTTVDYDTTRTNIKLYFKALD